MDSFEENEENKSNEKTTEQLQEKTDKKINKKKNKKEEGNMMDMFKIKSSKKTEKKEGDSSDNEDEDKETEDNSDSDDDNLFQTQTQTQNFSDEDLFDSGKTNWEDDFLDPSKEFEDISNNIIEISTQDRGRKKTTVIVGLELKKEEEKQFLTQVKKKVAGSGSKKKVLAEELEGGSYKKDKSKKGQPKPKDALKVEIFIFTGDCKEEIREILINNFNIDEEKIVC
jgi:translation initiation factor 1 (eIF-1/SUI1)